MSKMYVINKIQSIKMAQLAGEKTYKQQFGCCNSSGSLPSRGSQTSENRIGYVRMLFKTVDN